MLWEDGFCNFSACAGAAATGQEITAASKSADDAQPPMNLDLFFKMSHEVYNYGEGYSCGVHVVFSASALVNISSTRPLQLFNFLAHPTTRPAGYDA
jgi:hypothetical protein